MCDSMILDILYYVKQANFFLSTQVPYAHFDKKDKVGRTADFVFQQYQQQQQQSQNQNSYFAQKQIYQARRRYKTTYSIFFVA